MFCPKCGNTIQPNETFCSACGTAVNQQPAAAAPAAEEKKANPLAGVLQNKNLLENKKTLIIGAGALVAVILVIVLFAGLFSAHSSAEKVAKAYVKANETYDYAECVDLMPDFYTEYLAEEIFDMKEYDKDKLVRKMEKSTGNDKEDGEDIEVKIIEVELQDDKDDVKDAKEAVRSRLKTMDCYDIMEDVDDYVYVEVGYEVDDEDGESTLLCVKISGKWYVLG